MNIYLDIDGTMIHEDLSANYGKPAILRYKLSK